jgi:hypothetical protein
MGYPAPNNGYPAAEPKPSGGTAITAGVLAVLGGLVALTGVVGGLIKWASLDSPFIPALIGLVISALLIGLLLPGGILLLLRKPAGRMLTIDGSALAIVLYAAFFLMTLLGAGQPAIAGFATVGGLAALLFMVPAIATLVLAIAKPTASWVGTATPG